MSSSQDDNDPFKAPRDSMMPSRNNTDSFEALVDSIPDDPPAVPSTAIMADNAPMPIQGNYGRLTKTAGPTKSFASGQLTIIIPLSAAEADAFPSEAWFDKSSFSVFNNSTTGVVHFNLNGRYKPFPFLKLPPELRNNIYEYTLQFSSPSRRIEMNAEGRTRNVQSVVCKGTKNQKAGRAHASALLRANRQIHEEALAYLYGDNYFYFSQTHALLGFLRNAPMAIQHLKYIHLGHLMHAKGGDAKEMFRLLEKATKLEQFCFGKHFIRETNFESVMSTFAEGPRVLIGSLVKSRGSVEAAVKVFHFKFLGNSLLLEPPTEKEVRERLMNAYKASLQHVPKKHRTKGAVGS